MSEAGRKPREWFIRIGVCTNPSIYSNRPSPGPNWKGSVVRVREVFEVDGVEVVPSQSVNATTNETQTPEAKEN